LLELLSIRRARIRSLEPLSVDVNTESDRWESLLNSGEPNYKTVIGFLNTVNRTCEEAKKAVEGLSRGMVKEWLRSYVKEVWNGVLSENAPEKRADKFVEALPLLTAENDDRVDEAGRAGIMPSETFWLFTLFPKAKENPRRFALNLGKTLSIIRRDIIDEEIFRWYRKNRKGAPLSEVPIYASGSYDRPLTRYVRKELLSAFRFVSSDGIFVSSLPYGRKKPARTPQKKETEEGCKEEEA